MENNAISVGTGQQAPSSETSDLKVTYMLPHGGKCQIDVTPESLDAASRVLFSSATRALKPVQNGLPEDDGEKRQLMARSAVHARGAVVRSLRNLEEIFSTLDLKNPEHKKIVENATFFTSTVLPALAGISDEELKKSLHVAGVLHDVSEARCPDCDAVASPNRNDSLFYRIHSAVCPKDFSNT